MTTEAWARRDLRSVGVVLVGDAINEYNERGERIADDTFTMLLNSDPNPVDFTLPRIGERWSVVLRTSGRSGSQDDPSSGQALRLEGRSALLLRRVS
jgi:isoamylase